MVLLSILLTQSIQAQCIARPSWLIISCGSTAGLQNFDPITLCQPSELIELVLLLRALIYSLQPLKLYILYLCMCLRLTASTSLGVICEQEPMSSAFKYRVQVKSRRSGAIPPGSNGSSIISFVTLTKIFTFL